MPGVKCQTAISSPVCQFCCGSAFYVRTHHSHHNNQEQTERTNTMSIWTRLFGSSKPPTLATKTSPGSDGSTPTNYKSRLRPFGNKLRYPSKYLQYFVFIDEEHMRTYYSALKRHINAGDLPPRIIEVCMVRLKDDCLPAVRAYRAPYAIVWTEQGEDEFHLWAVACVQHVNGIATMRFANHGSEHFDYVKEAIVKVYDWDILFPKGIEKDRESLARYLTDDSAPSPSPQPDFGSG